MQAARTPAAAAPRGDAEPAPKRRSTKKILVVAVTLALLLGLGAAGAAVYLGHVRQAAEAAEDDEPQEAARPQRPDPDVVPTFVPLEPFTVNLADRETERYAQIGVTLELEDAKATDRIKAYMPAIRNNILMVLAHKTSQQLVEREGKEKLAAEILRETLRPLGYDTPAPARDGETPPVRRVHFSNFIIQ